MLLRACTAFPAILRIARYTVVHACTLARTSCRAQRLVAARVVAAGSRARSRRLPGIDPWSCRRPGSAAASSIGVRAGPGLPAPSSELAASIHLSPFHLLYDGYSAVYIFFCLSGYVLTRSFERQLDRPQLLILARVVRLGLPAPGATVFAGSLMLIFGRAYVEAGQLIGNAWFIRQWTPDLTLLSIVRDGTINALFLGYRDMPGLAFLAPWQSSVEQSFVAPFWTLSIEFYGSIVILLLCGCARRSRRLWWAAVALGMIFTIRSAYFCFFAGHLLAAFHRAERPVSRRELLPIGLVIAGLACCVVADVWQPEWLVRFCYYQTYWLFPGQVPPMQQRCFGAILMLAGIIDLQGCRNVLSGSWLVSHSRLSFPLYLVHWPIICSVVAIAFVHLDRTLGVGLAQLAAIALGLAASVAASSVFASVDQYAVRVSRRLRRPAAVPSAIRPTADTAGSGGMKRPVGATCLKASLGRLIASTSSPNRASLAA
jgi:peptidoglycan/LPS O-acetylase OafA/YrhL